MVGGLGIFTASAQRLYMRGPFQRMPCKRKGAQHLFLALKRLKFCFVRLLEQRGLLHFKVLRGSCFGPFAGFSCERHNLTTNLGVSKRYFSMLGTARF